MKKIAQMIDHTLLKPDACADDIKGLCTDATEHNFAAVCIHPTWVRFAAKLLNQTDVKVATVIGFPLGATTTATKKFETIDAIENGATEIDMVINIGALKGGNDEQVTEEIRQVVEAATPKAIVKVIIETSLLSQNEKRRACLAAVKAGAQFVKTSTGFSGGGATIDDIKLMREIVGQQGLGVKASGGVRDRETAVNMIAAGATRIGTSSGIAIVKNEQGQSSY